MNNQFMHSINHFDTTKHHDPKLNRLDMIFDYLPAITGWDDAKYYELAKLMIEEKSDLLNPKEENSAISAGYTYLGQFINHDLTFNLISELQRINGDENVNSFRTPCLDLDSVYGFGPKIGPHMYANDKVRLLTGQVSEFKILPTEAFEKFEFTLHSSDDLPRIRELLDGELVWTTAIIGDPRNDENIIISQLHLAFLKFHNRVVSKLESLNCPKEKIFRGARRLTTWHYQWIVRNDFLNKIIGNQVIRDIERNGRQFFTNEKCNFLPLEFSVAAFRFGHSLVRSLYRINSNLNHIPIFKPTKHHLQLLEDHFGEDEIEDDSMVGFKQRKMDWTIDWSRFFGCDLNHPFNLQNEFPQPARKINTKLALGLSNLPENSLTDFRQNNLLPYRNLLRGDSVGLPSGQCIAREMKLPNRLILNSTDDCFDDIHEIANGAETPLWFYILREAEELECGKCLGPVGGQIVAEVLISLLEGDENSYLHCDPNWSPKESLFGDCFDHDFTTIDFLNISEGKLPNIM